MSNAIDTMATIPMPSPVVCALDLVGALVLLLELELLLPAAAVGELVASVGDDVGGLRINGLVK